MGDWLPLVSCPQGCRMLGVHLHPRGHTTHLSIKYAGWTLVLTSAQQSYLCASQGEPHVLSTVLLGSTLYCLAVGDGEERRSGSEYPSGRVSLPVLGALRLKQLYVIARPEQDRPFICKVLGFLVQFLFCWDDFSM